RSNSRSLSQRFGRPTCNGSANRGCPPVMARLGVNIFRAFFGVKWSCGDRLRFFDDIEHARRGQTATSHRFVPKMFPAEAPDHKTGILQSGDEAILRIDAHMIALTKM